MRVGCRLMKDEALLRNSNQEAFISDIAVEKLIRCLCERRKRRSSNVSLDLCTFISLWRGAFNAARSAKTD